MGVKGDTPNLNKIKEMRGLENLSSLINNNHFIILNNKNLKNENGKGISIFKLMSSGYLKSFSFNQLGIIR